MKFLQIELKLNILNPGIHLCRQTLKYAGVLVGIYVTRLNLAQQHLASLRFQRLPFVYAES